MKERSRFRGKFVTSVLAEFAAYVNVNATSAARGFIDPSDFSAVCIMNLGDEATPGHADWRAILNLTEVAGFRCVKANNGKKFSQRELAEWCEDWIDYLTLDGKQTMVEAIAAIRNVQVSQKKVVSDSVGNLNASRTALEQLQFDSHANELPSVLTFTTEPFVGFEPRKFAFRLAATTTCDVTTWALRIMRMESAMEAVADEFKDKLQKAIIATYDFRIGSFSA